MKKTDTEQIRIDNRKQIIEYLRVHGPIARVDMGQALKLSPATITAITSALFKSGRLTELPVEADVNASRGRPRVLIDLAPDAAHVLGLKLSINELRLMLSDQKGQIIRTQVIELQTLKLSEQGLIDALNSAIRFFVAKLPPKQKPQAIGIAVQGVVNGRNGEIVWSPALTHKHFQLQQPLEQIFKLPVIVANDANCLAIAVRHQPKYQQLKDFTVVMLGYGVGMGVFVNGELYLGHHGAAAEFGHTKYCPEGAPCLCGKQGCIEAYVSDYALYRDACAITPLLPQDDHLHPTDKGMMQLIELANQNNPEISELFNRAGRVLGYGLANVIALMSPEKVIISGPGIRAYKHIKDGIHSGLESALVKELIGQTTLETVEWNEDMTIRGVIALALQLID